MRRRLQEAAMGVSVHADKFLSQDPAKRHDDNKTQTMVTNRLLRPLLRPPRSVFVRGCLFLFHKGLCRTADHPIRPT